MSYYKIIFVKIISLFTCVCNILMFLNLKLRLLIFKGKNLVPKSIYFFKNFKSAPKRICSFKNFLYICVYINNIFTPFRTYRRKRMSMNFLAIARNFYLFKEVLENFK